MLWLVDHKLITDLLKVLLRKNIYKIASIATKVLLPLTPPHSFSAILDVFSAISGVFFRLFLTLLGPILYVFSAISDVFFGYFRRYWDLFCTFFRPFLTSFSAILDVIGTYFVRFSAISDVFFGYFRRFFGHFWRFFGYFRRFWDVFWRLEFILTSLKSDMIIALNQYW